MLMKKKLNFYDYFWIFFIGSFVGVILEEVYWLVKTGNLESRQGLIYGPFNLVYGLGALFLTMCLVNIKSGKNETMHIFSISFVIGSLFEYLCSVFQEEMFGTISWEYGAKLLNINGRITLQYSIFWGILGILWMKYMLPGLVDLIHKIPIKINHTLTYILLIFMIFNALVSFIAAYRENERYNGIEARNSFERYIDRKYPDEYMRKIFPNSRHVNVKN